MAHTGPEIAYDTSLPEVHDVVGDSLDASSQDDKLAALRTHRLLTFFFGFFTRLSKRMVVLICICVISASVAVAVAVQARFRPAANGSVETRYLCEALTAYTFYLDSADFT